MKVRSESGGKREGGQHLLGGSDEGSVAHGQALIMWGESGRATRLRLNLSFAQISEQLVFFMPCDMDTLTMSSYLYQRDKQRK